MKASETPRWKYRPTIACAVALGAVVLPVAVAVALAVLIEMLVPEPASSFGRSSWWIGVLGLSSVALFICERAARRALPLSILLKMGLVFPGVAPKRLDVALRAASTRDLGWRVEETRSKEVVVEPIIAVDAIVKLSACLSAHDRRTRGHAERVRALTELVANDLKLPNADRDRLRWTALLHDVVKLALHPEFLNKKGPLSSVERKLIRRHPLEGARLEVPLSSWLGDWSSTIPEHHGHHHCGGYLFGLTGDAISLGGRIVAVVDAYDVMTSVRSSRRPHSPDAARAALARLAGSQFDPVVVRAFLAIPVKRLRSRSPLARLGSLPFGNERPELAVVGRTATALAVAGSIVGLTSWQPWAAQDGVVALAAHASLSTGGQGGTAAGSATPRAAGGDKGAQKGGLGTKSRSGRDSEDQRVGGGRVPGSSSGATGFGGTSSSIGGKQHSVIGPSGRGGAAPSPTTTSPGPGSTSPPPATTTTAPPPTTSTTSPPPATTTTAPPPTTTTSPPQAPSPPTSLSLTATCTSFEIGVVITLEWTDSTSSWVTGYEILRSWNGSDYSAIADAEAGATTYSDSSDLWFGTTYWYEVEALSPEGSATSAPAQTTTPITCES